MLSSKVCNKNMDKLCIASCTIEKEGRGRRRREWCYIRSMGMAQMEGMSTKIRCSDHSDNEVRQISECAPWRCWVWISIPYFSGRECGGKSSLIFGETNQNVGGLM